MYISHIRKYGTTCVRVCACCTFCTVCIVPSSAGHSGGGRGDHGREGGVIVFLGIEWKEVFSELPPRRDSGGGKLLRVIHCELDTRCTYWGSLIVLQDCVASLFASSEEQ